MKYAIAIFVLLCSLQVQAKPCHAPKQPQRPYIVWTAPGFDRCVSTDPAGPCEGVLIAVKNPLPYRVWVAVSAVSCARPDQKNQRCVIVDEHANVWPGQTFNFDIGAGVGPVADGTVGMTWQKAQ